MQKIRVSKRGYDLLFERKKSFLDKLRHVQSQKGEAAEVGGNVWHDNFAFEDLVRQESIINRQIANISLCIQRAEIVDAPCHERVLAVGHIALLVFEDGTQKEIEIVGFGEGDIYANPQKVEYSAPLVSPFIDTEMGAEEEINISGKKQTVTLLKIMRKGG